MKAFVSFVRAYSKHEASYIFRVKDLDFVGLAKSFGLLRLPRMPELKNISRSGWTDGEIDVRGDVAIVALLLTGIPYLQWDTYAYLDIAQEAKRLTEASKPSPSPVDIQRRKEERAVKQTTNGAWSNKARKQEEKEKRREKKDRKKKWEKAQAKSAVEAGTKRNRESGDEHEDQGDDWEDLAREERMAKRVKKGQLTQNEFDAEFANL